MDSNTTTTSKKERKRRLLAAAVYLESIPKDCWDHFDMNEWYQTTKASEGEREGAPDEAAALLVCGTTACAGGWLCMVPEFRLLGLRLRRRRGYVCPDYSGRPFVAGNGFEVLQQFFALSKKQSTSVFHGSGYRLPHQRPVTPLDVAKRLRELAAEVLR